MTQSGLRTKLLSNEDEVKPVEIDLNTGSFGPKIFQGQNPPLRNWKISAPMPESFDADKKAEPLDFADEEMARIRAASSATAEKLRIQTPAWLVGMQYVAIFLSVAWLTFSAIYVLSLPQTLTQLFSTPLAAGGIFSTVLAPIALLWLCINTWQRRSDAHLYAEALRLELQRLLFPSKDQAVAVNRDIQLLVQQAVEVSASSRAALKAIQRARQGLRSEIRDFSGMSQKTEFHIDRLSETLNKRAEELLKITDQIEQRSKNISEEVKTGVEVWSEVSQEALVKVLEIQNNFEESTQSFEDQTQLLNAASQKLQGEVVRLETGFEKGFSKLETLGTSSVDSFERITGSLEKFDSLADGIFTKTEMVESKLTKQTESMQAAAANLSARVSELDLIGSTAAHKLGEALAMALSGSDSIVSAVRRAREQLEKAATETSHKADEMLEETDRRIENLSSSAAERLGRVQEMLSGFDKRQRDIEDIITQLSLQNENVSVVTDTALDRLTSAVHLLDQSAQTIDIKSAKPVADIREATEELSQQVGRIHESLKAGVEDIDSNTSKARVAADEIATSLKAHTQDLAMLSSQVTGHARSVNSQLDDHKEKLTSFIDATSSRIDGFEEKLANQLSGFARAVETVEVDMDSLGSQLEEKSAKAVETVKVHTEELKAVETNVAEQLTHLSAQTIQTQFLVQDYENGIRASVEATLPLYEKITAGVEEADNRFDRLRDSAEASSKDIFERMEELSRELEQQVAKLNNEVETSERSLTSLSNDIQGSVTTIGNTAEAANEKLKHLHVSLQGRTEDLQLLADQAELRVNNLQNSFDTNTTAIKGALSQATEKLVEATEQFEKSSDMIEDRAATSSRKIEQVSHLFIEEGHRLAMAGEQTLHKASRIATAIQTEGEQLASRSEDALVNLQRASDTLSVRAREIEEYTKAALNNTQGYNDSLKDQVRAIAESSSLVVDTISDSLGHLQTQIDETTRQGDKIVDRVEKARQALVKESERLESVTRKAGDIADEASGKFTRHSANILKSAEDISGHAERIRDLQIRSSREAFLSSAKFIIESLHSLSVDVSRHLEDDVDDRSWRAYQKGDVSVFTRRLVTVAGDMALEKVRRKFAEDSEFRSYTQRYIRQFEELFDAAQNNDHGELLSSIFVSSDVGKLYRLLCDISGRAAKAA